MLCWDAWKQLKHGLPGYPNSFLLWGVGNGGGGGGLIIVHVFAGCTLHCVPCCQSLFFWGERLTVLHVFCGMHISLYTMLSEPFFLEGKINSPSCVLWDAHFIIYHVVRAFFFYIPPPSPPPTPPFKMYALSGDRGCYFSILMCHSSSSTCCDTLKKKCKWNVSRD